MRTALLCLALVLTLSRPARAHRLSTASLRLDPDGPPPPGANTQALAGRLDLPLRDLALAVAIDPNEDGAITWGELRGAARAIEDYVRAGLRLSGSGEGVGLAFGAIQVSDLAGEPCASLPFTGALPVPGPARLEYGLLFALDPEHRCLVRLGHTGNPRTAVLGPDRRELAWETGAGASEAGRGEARLETPPAGFVREGIHHIAIGFDHVLFLLALLLPAVLRREGGGVAGRAGFVQVAREVLRVVTAFTVAHSLTLALAAFDVLRLPSRLVETTIAASVAVAAANNLVPFFRERGGWVAFGFGLVHGFGFAGVLADLDLPAAGFAAALLGFNVGVELGQLAIVAVFLPVAFLLRDSWAYRRIAFQAGSAGIACLAAFWVLERALGPG